MDKVLMPLWCGSRAIPEFLGVREERVGGYQKGTEQNDEERLLIRAV